MKFYEEAIMIKTNPQSVEKFATNAWALAAGAYLAHEAKVNIFDVAKNTEIRLQQPKKTFPIHGVSVKTPVATQSIHAQAHMKSLPKPQSRPR
jgi:hypothetical protein